MVACQVVSHLIIYGPWPFRLEETAPAFWGWCGEYLLPSGTSTSTWSRRTKAKVGPCWLEVLIYWGWMAYVGLILLNKRF